MERPRRTKRRASRRLVGAAIALGLLASIASCGARTGLFGPEPPFDAAIEAAPDAPDATADAPKDAPADVVEEPVPCIPGTFDFKLATPQLMFVIDRSGSMDSALDSDEKPPAGQPTRWTALASSLGQAISPFSDDIAMGARFFPVNNSFLQCAQDPPEFAIIPALGNAPAILDVFQKSVPLGATPTAPALERAALEVSTSRAVGRAMVLATDGAPNCNAALDPGTCACTGGDCTNSPESCLDDNRTVKTIAGIFNDEKIPVYVIGIGVTASFASTLDAMAVAGGRPRSGTPRYFPGDSPSALTGAFATIRDSVGKCSYITPSSPTDPNAISVVIDGKVIPRDATHQNGWDWVDQAFGHLQLFGAACDAASASNVSGTVSCK